MFSSKMLATLLALIILLHAQASAQSLCPQLCMTNCSNGNCTTCHSSFELGAPQSTCACPTSTFLNSTTGLCTPCSITCLTCVTYSRCMTCVPGFLLSNSFTCIPGKLNANGWVSKDVSYDLTGSNPSGGDLSAFINSSSVSLNSNNTFVSNCSKLPGFNWLGGYQAFDYTTKVVKKVYALPPHQWMNIRFQVVLIDKWVGNTLLLQVPSLQNSTTSSSLSIVWQGSYVSQMRFADFCGNSSIPDNLAIVDAWIPHNLSSTYFRIRMNQSDTPFNASSTLNQAFFAIRQLYVRVGTCGRGCRYCSSPSQCTECILPYTLSTNGTCICNSTFGFLTATGCESNCLSGYYYNSTANTCLNCEQMVENCQTCNTTVCLTCSINFFYFNNGNKVQCVRYCPDTYTESRKVTIVGNQTIIADSCVACPANCKTCNYDLCLFCVQGFMYNKGTCVATCPQSTFAKEGSCLRCPANCLNCVSTSSCSLCSSGYFPTATGICTPYCFNTTVLPNATLGCNYNCTSNCLTCFGPNSNQCLSCSSSTYLQAGQCVSTCSIGFYQSSSQCLPCSAECYSCSNNQSCLTCSQGYYLIFSGNSNNVGSCVRLCPSAYYPLKTSVNAAGTIGMGQCVPCPTACQRCKNPSFCMSCSEDYYYFNLTCLQSPPVSYYYDRQMRHFKPCQPNCLQCDELVCSLCDSGYFLDQGTCVTDCGPNKVKVLRTTSISSRKEDDQEDSDDGHKHYKTSAYSTTQNGFCEWRSPKCEVYDSSRLDGSCAQCSTFMPNLVLRQTSTNASSCFFNCPEFYTKSSNYCAACPSYCRRCNSNMQCFECLYNYVINHPDLITSANIMTQTCVPNYCANNYYSDSVQCQKCTAGCAVCQIDGRCITCISGYLPTRETGICYPQNCASTQYLNLGSCNSCLTPCLTCSSANQCTSCYSNSTQINYLYDGTCISNCPGGYFAHRDSRTCRKCNPKCSTCQHFYNCLTCIPNFYLLSFYNEDQAQCVAECPIGFYSNTSTCLSCSRDCKSCYGPSQYQCLTCYSNFVLDEGKCVYQCADAKYVDEFGHCDWCDSSCNDCNGPTSQNCISCGIGYYIADNVCYKDSCPGATYLAHFKERICERCQFGCAMCNSPQFCKFCYPGYNLYRGWCYLKCPGNLISSTIRFTYLDNIEGYICKDCLLVFSANCRKCNKHSCIRCASGYYLYKASADQCVTACPNGTYVKSYEAKECVACQPYCANCTNYQNCLKCSYPYNLINGYCSASCPAGSYLTAYQNCSICPSPCATCTTASSCSSCLPKFYLFTNSSGNVCLTDCPPGYFADTRSGWCSRCLSTCSACVATNNCTQCAAGYTLFNGICQNQTSCLTSLSNCQSCNNQSCLRCVQPYLLFINHTTGVSSCLSTCPTGYYSSVFTCEACNSSCTTCLNTPNSCSQCQSGLYLYGQSCVAICPIGFYANSTLQACQSCPSNCLNCQQSTCYACQAGFLLYLGQCYSTCPSTTYANVGMGLCQDCAANCTSCSGDENCTSCVSGTILYNGTCSEGCPMTAFNSTDSVGNFNCQPCVSPCYTCTDRDTCISCIPNYVLNGTVCQQACNAGYYYLTLTLSYDGQDQYYNFTNFTQCYPCDPACSICSTAADDCQACNDLYILYGGKCLANCPLGTFFVNNSCISCSYGCLACNQSAFCQVCANNTVLYMGQCLLSCPDGFYASKQVNSTQNQYVCQPCSYNCRTCSGPSLYECSSCTDNTYFANNGECLTTCPAGTYVNPMKQSCSSCPYGCSQCTSPTNCSVCKSNFTLTSTKQCKQISVCNISNCQSCSSANSSICAQCLPNYFLYNSSCFTTCPTSTFAQNGVCSPCSVNCLSCNAYACMNCTNSTFLFQGICVVSCPVGTFPTATGNCQKDPCLVYNSASNDCLQCAPPYLLVNQSVTITSSTSLYLTVCVLNCPSGFVQSGSSCANCSTNCLSCVSSTICSKCIAGTYLYQGSCITSCPLGTFASISSCQPCSLPYCSQCVSNNGTQTCTSCVETSGAFLVNGNCVFVCPSGTYRDATSQNCFTCSSNCISCSNSQSCSNCSSGYFLYLGQCVTACPSGTFANGAICNLCSTGCFQCSNSYTCSLCQSQYSLFAISTNSSYCVPSCPTGYFSQAVLSTSFSNSNQFKCVLCMSPCLTCTSASTCTQCASGYSLLGSTCVITCPSGYYMGYSQGIVVNGVTYTTSTCYSCSASCLTCNNTSTYCLSCPSGYILDANNNCVSNCVSPTSYYSPTTRMCSNCSQQCYSCYGPGTDNCISCRPPLQLYASSCLSNCPFGYFSTPSYVCQVCSTSCLTCSASATNCTSCQSGLYLQTNNGSSVCKNTCPNGQYLDQTVRACALCASPCLTCSSVSQCLTCPTGYYFYNQACLTTCPTATGPVFTSAIATCSPCPANCVTCVSTAAYMSLTCTLCSTGFYLVNGACSQNCPSGTYASPTSYSCTDCGIIGCQTCFLNTALNVSCTACLTTYYSYNGTCVSACPNGTIPSGGSCVPQPVCQGYQWNGYCIASCPTGTFPTAVLSTISNTTTLTCTNCSAFCMACTSSTSCSSCANSTYLYSSGSTTSCVSACPSGTYLVSGSCTTCPSPCLTCQLSSTGISCLNCLSGFLQLGSSCYTACPVGFFQNGTRCNICSSVCLQCSGNSTNCVTCKNTNGIAPSCVSPANCTSSQYQNSSTTCSNCDSSCLTCYGGANYECLSCANSSNILISGSCTANCPSGSIRNSTNCVACPSNCLSCTLSGSSLVCNSCASPFILFSSSAITGICVQSCSSLNSATQNYVLVNGQCQLCTIAGCTFCTYTGTQFQCSSCQNATYLYNQTCIPACPSGTMPSGFTCTACSQNCLTCNTAGCTSCKTGFFLQNGNCVTSCGSGSYSVNGICNQCTATNCLICNSTSCLSCQQPYLLTNGQCSSCVSGYYISSGICQACLMPCLTCLGSSTACTSCASGYLLFNSTNCVVTCPSGYYATTTGSCSACSYTNCQTCTSTSCSACVSGYVLVGTQSCQTSCPSNMYLSTSTNSCINCSASCSSCTSSTSCLACLSPFVLSQGYCLSSCPSGMYNANSTCITCPSGCKTCISALNCTSCNSGLTLSASGTCSVPPNNCSSGYYLNTLNSCSQCFSTCLTCSAGGSSNCITCFAGYTLTNGVCVQVCSADSYYNTNSTCQLCNMTFSNCLSCTSSGCLTCASNYTALNGNCVQTCPSGTYLSNSICLSCPAFCLSCSSSSSCSQCINSTLLLISGLCYTSCPAQTYFVNNSCASCYQTCLTCAGSSTNCSSCITPYNLYGNNCTSACPTGTFSSNYTCQNCSTNCVACSGLNACSQCSSGLYLINGTCRTTCPSGYYIDASSNRCIQCATPCLVCLSRTACTSCQSPYTLRNGVCINSNCSAGYYDFSLNTCVNCTVNHCGFCTNTSCSSCLSGYYSIYMNGILTYCQPACIAGTFADNTTMNCSSCFTNCFSCVNSTWCSMCNSGYYVLSLAGANANECVTVCPYGYYQNSSTYQCTPCASNCLSCYNQAMCLVCSSYYYQLASNGSVTCVSNCPDMYYTPTAVDGTGQCGPCGTNCYACVDALTCTQCLSSSYVIVSGTCTPYNCVHCFSCNSNNNTCNQCLSSYYLFNNGCTATCPDAYYPDNSTGQCLPCVTNCLLCQQANSCMLCISGYVFINGTGCENKGLLDFGRLGNMSGFTSNITRIMSIVYVSTSSGPIAFGAIGSTYGPMQFCQFMYLLQGSSGGNEEVNNFLNSLSAVSYTSSSGTNSNENQTSSSSQRRLLTAINYTATFLQTNMPIFLIMAGFISAYIMVLVLERYSNSCCGSCPNLLKYANYMCEFMKLRFKYIYVDTVMWISYLPFLYFAILQLKAGSYDTGMQIFSSLLAIAIIIIYPLYPVFILRKIFDRSDKEAEDLRNYKSITLKEPPRVDNEKGMCEDFTCCEPADTRKALVEMSLSPYIDKVVRPVFNEFDHEHPEYSEFRYFKVEHWRLAYAPIKYVRKFIYVLIVALCPDPITSLILLIVITCAYMAYLVVLKPKEKLYLVLEIILESVLLFFIVFMLIYVSMGGASVSSLSVVTHAIGFIIANSTLAIAIILNLMAYYTIFCCIYDFIKHLRDRAIEDDIKEKAFEEVVEDKEKIDQKDKDFDEKEIRKSLNKRGDDQMTVENNEQENYVQYDLDEKEFNVRSSMINKKKTFEDEEPEEDFTNLKSTKNPKAKSNRKDRRKSNHRLQEESHTSQEMGQSKIAEQEVADGLLKDRVSKYKREVNKNDVNIDRGELRQPTDKFRKKNHKISEPQEQESLEVLRPDKKQRVQDEFVADIDTHDRMVPNKKMEYDIDPNFAQRQSKRRQKKNEESQDIPEANLRKRESANRQANLKGDRDLEDGNMVNRDRRKKEDPYGFNDPSDPANAKTYDRQGKRNKAPIGNDEIEDINTFSRNNNKNKDNMPDANLYDRKGDNKRGQNEKDLLEGNMMERNKKKQENPFGEFQQMFANQDAQAIREAQMQERKRKEKEQSLSNEKLVSGFSDNAIPVERKNQLKKYQNLHYKGSDEEQEVREGQVVQAKNRFRKNVKNSQKNIPEGDINAVGKDIKTKKVDRMQSNKEFVEDSLEQAKYKERQGKDIQKMKSLNEKAEQGVQEGLTYNREKKVAERKKLEEQKIESGNLLSPSPVKPKIKPNLYDDLGEDFTESVEFQEGRKQEMKLKRAPKDEQFVEQSMEKAIKSKGERQKRAQDNRMQISENLQESYEDAVRKNKDQVFKPVAGNKSNLIALGEDDQFEQISYSRPESKIERPKSRSKDMGLGVNSRNASQTSDNESRDIRKQRNSAIQRQRKKGTLNVNDKEEQEDEMNVGNDSRRISRIKKKSKIVKGVLNIDDKSENDDIEDLQL